MNYDIFAANARRASDVEGNRRKSEQKDTQKQETNSDFQCRSQQGTQVKASSFSPREIF